MLCCIQEHIEKAQAESPIGWAVAIAGTVRSAYVRFDGSTSYDESEAHLLPTRDEAWEFAKTTGNKDKFERFIEVVPALESLRKQNPCRQGLPTIDGKHPSPFEQARAQNPMLSHGQYLLLSQIFYWNKTVKLGSVKESSAILLHTIDHHRPFNDFRSLSFDDFCQSIQILAKETLKCLERSPDWILAYQYAVNPQKGSLVLRKLLNVKPEITLPITPELLDELGLPIGSDLRSEAMAIALFEY
jgi:hypothetical protein